MDFKIMSFIFIMIRAKKGVYDQRCLCTCSAKGSEVAQIFTAFVPDTECFCEEVLPETVRNNQDICPSCVCVYKPTNSTPILLSVLVIFWVLGILFGYLMLRYRYSTRQNHGQRPNRIDIEQTAPEEVAILLMH